MDGRQELLLTMLRGSGSEARDRCLRVGAETLPEETLVALLREEADDVARNAGLEMLKLRGRRSFAIAVQLLGDDDDDVVLQGVLLLDAIGDPRAWPRLRPLLGRSNQNIVQAAITAAGRLGSRDTVADIVPFLDGDLWMRMAALATLGQLRSRAAAGAVAKLLSDADLGGAAAEALARIGGMAAARALIEEWIAHENAEWLPLIAQSLADIAAPANAAALRLRVLRHLSSDIRETAAAAAAIILSLGAGEEDGRALDTLVAASGADDPLPRCLARRSDLAEWLISAAAPARNWGYELVRRDPLCVAREALERAIVAAPPDDAALLVELARRHAGAPTLVTLYVRNAAARDDLAPILHRHRAAVLREIEARPELTPAMGILLKDAAGTSADDLLDAIARLDSGERAEVVGQLHGRRLLARLPWPQWIEDDRDGFAALLGDVVARRGVRDLLPLVRRELQRDPLPELIAAAGALRDRAALPLLIAALPGCAPSARSTLFESIAAIGGAAARDVLLRYAGSDDRADVRFAARALAQHAVESDCALLRDLARHSDWAVRHAAAEALGRFSGAENSAALAALAADASAVVAQRARAWLDACGSSA